MPSEIPQWCKDAMAEIEDSCIEPCDPADTCYVVKLDEGAEVIARHAPATAEGTKESDFWHRAYTQLAKQVMQTAGLADDFLEHGTDRAIADLASLRSRLKAAEDENVALRSVVEAAKHLRTELHGAACILQALPNYHSSAPADYRAYIAEFEAALSSIRQEGKE
jgi:hypothetical protein